MIKKFIVGAVLVCAMAAPVAAGSLQGFQRSVINMYNNAAVEILYNLFAQFTSANDNCVNTDVIGTDCGDATAITDGTLTVTDTSTGDVAITSNELVITPTGSGWDEARVYGAAVTRARGETFMWKIDRNTTEDMMFSLHASGTGGFITNEYELDHLSSTNAYVGDRTNTYTTNPAWTIVSGETYEYAVVLGGFNSTAWAWDGVSATWDYGAFAFQKTGEAGNWELMHVQPTGGAATVYPRWASYSTAITIDNLKNPDVDLSSFVAPLANDQFDGTNGQTVESGGTYTDTEIFPSGETTWHKRTDECTGGAGNSVWDINTNKLEFDTGGTDCTNNADYRILYMDVGESDVIAQVNAECDLGNPSWSGLMFRGSAETGSGENHLMFSIHGDGANCDPYLYDMIDGSFTELDSDTAGTMTGGGRYNLLCVVEGNNQDCYINGVPWVAATSSFNNTATRVGFWHYDLNTGVTYNNFAVWVRGTGGEYNDLDNY